MTKLSRGQISRVQDTLLASRTGSATLVELATAHELCEGAGLEGCVTELRARMREKLDAGQSGTGRDLLLGLASGALTHYMLRGL